MTIIAQFFFKPHLEPEEKILEVCHRHIFTFLPEFFRISLLGFLIPGFLWLMFPEFGLFFLLWVAISVIRVFYALFNWYHDALLITNLSLVKVGWNGFFDRTSTRLEYHMIEGITYAIRGFRRTLFNYGDVSVERAGGGVAISLLNAVNPTKVERLVLNYQEQFTSDQNLKDASTLKNLLTVMLRHHAKKEGIPKSEPQKNQ